MVALLPGPAQLFTVLSNIFPSDIPFTWGETGSEATFMAYTTNFFCYLCEGEEGEMAK